MILRMNVLHLLTIWIGVPVLLSGTAFLLRAEIPMAAELQQKASAKTTLARRRAARELMQHDAEAAQAIVALTKDDDVVIRREATRRLRSLLGDRALPLYEEALRDYSPLVRMVAVEELMAYSPRSDAVTEFLVQASSDADDKVRKLAASAFWSFHRDYIPLRDRPNWDHTIEIVSSAALPLEGWRFRTDPGAAGHVRNWFALEMDEAEWHDIVIGKLWDNALPDKVGHFEGIAWYRVDFIAPQKPEVEFNEAVLHFEAVDESAWVWVNGHYAGSHDRGPGGYQDPFDIEVGPFIIWGQPNQIAVRVLNTAGAGGIYKPVEFQILR